MPRLRKILNVLIIISLVAVFAFGVMSIAPIHHHEPGCPLMPGEQAICPMGLFEHISSWKNIFAVSINSIFFLLTLGAFLILTLWRFVNLSNFTLALKRFEKDNLSRASNLYQELFSRGILNPKVP